MKIRIQHLSDLIQAVKKIRKHSPNTGNLSEFRTSLISMDTDDLFEFCQAIGTASIAASHVERDATVEVE